MAVTVKTNSGAMLKELRELEDASKALDGIITTIGITPDDPSSLEIAVEEMKRAVDTRMAPYAHNRIVKDIAEKSKVSYEQRLRQKYKEISS